MSNYNQWNTFSTPYGQSHQQSSKFNGLSQNYQNLVTTPASPLSSIQPSSSYYGYNGYMNNTNQYSSPSFENQTFSSGYSSENNSFNNSPGYFNNNNTNNINQYTNYSSHGINLYSAFNQSNMLCNNNQKSVNSSKTTNEMTVNKTSSKKRPRINEEQPTNMIATDLNNLSDYSTDDLIIQVFQSASIMQKQCSDESKPSKTYKKRKVDNNDSRQLTEITNKNVSSSLIIPDTKDIEDLLDLTSENDLDDLSSEMNQSIMNQSGDKKKRVLTKSQRAAANQRERKRMNIMNDSFVKLREVLPISTGRKRRKMSRLDIVIGAMEYISYLDSLLESDEPCEINFEAYQNSLYML